jgi:hypothetical protein
VIAAVDAGVIQSLNVRAKAQLKRPTNEGNT